MEKIDLTKLIATIAFSTLIFSSECAFAEYTCTGTFLKSSGEYQKGSQITVSDYYYKKGTLVYGVPKVGYVDAKSIKLNKDCVLDKLERRLDLETAL